MQFVASEGAWASRTCGRKDGRRRHLPRKTHAERSGRWRQNGAFIPRCVRHRFRSPLETRLVALGCLGCVQCWPSRAARHFQLELGAPRPPFARCPASAPCSSPGPRFFRRLCLHPSSLFIPRGRPKLSRALSPWGAKRSCVRVCMRTALGVCSALAHFLLKCAFAMVSRLMSVRLYFSNRG